MAMTEKERIQYATQLAQAPGYKLPGLARKMQMNATPRKGQPEIRNKKKAAPTSAVKRTPYAYSGPDDTVGKAVTPKPSRRTITPFFEKRQSTSYDPAGTNIGPPMEQDYTDIGVDPRGSAIPRGPRNIPQYSARQVTPGVTEVISPGQADQSRFFTNLIESGADPTQLRGFMENQRANKLPQEVSYEGPLSDRPAATGGLARRGPVGYNAVTRGEKPGGVYSVGGRKRRGLGGIAAAAAEGRANRTSAIVRQRDRELDIRDRQASVEEAKMIREEDYGSPQNQLRLAQADYYVKTAESMMSKQEQLKYNRMIEKDKNIAKLFQMLEDPTLTPEQKERIYGDIQAYKQGLILTMTDPGKSGKDAGMFWFDKPDTEPTFEYLTPEESAKRRVPEALRRK